MWEWTSNGRVSYSTMGLSTCRNDKAPDDWQKMYVMTDSGERYIPVMASLGKLHNVFAYSFFNTTPLPHVDMIQ